ncbi:PREDICTED: uncharacterized protein LOC109215237 [Nicotiana attenuata]|uniref:uncharacterized protein LOC109215237 n=1 Tax=Nicotiana attenuata TaxID=49451 RepID=UPI000904B42F|nr:PREDICTED: uncharacterized protein LOC109215237 [Nicotiana attenuata]
MKAKIKAESNIIWKIQAGNSSFWWDNWTGKGALSTVIQVLGKSPKLLVNNFIHDGAWDTNKLADIIHIHLLETVTHVGIGNQNLSDFPIWNIVEDGHFNNNSAWISVETMNMFSLEVCSKIHMEYSWHLLGIKHQTEHVLATFKRWWETSSKNKKKLQLNIIVHQAIWNIKVAILKLIPTWDNQYLWPALCQRIERLKPIQSWKQVLWSTPNHGGIKVITNGSYIRERNKAGTGGIVRDSHGDLIMAFSMTVHYGNNNIAETLAAEFEIKRDTNNLKIKQVIDRMLSIIQQANVRVNHCFREDNQVADCLAKLPSTLGNSMTINSYQQLPRSTKGYLFLD